MDYGSINFDISGQQEFLCCLLPSDLSDLS